MPNEIQTITITNYPSLNEFSFFGLNWDNIRPPEAPFTTYGMNISTFNGLTATQVADLLESKFNSDVAGLGYPSRTISVTGTMNGTTLELTIEFTGDLAATDILGGIVSDWGDMDEPTFATIQEGGESAPESTPKLGRGGFGNMSHGNGFN